MKRARLIACATIRCSFADVPKRFREYIFPFGVMSRRNSSADL